MTEDRTAEILADLDETGTKPGRGEIKRLLQERQRLLEALKEARDEIKTGPTGDYYQFDAVIAFAEEPAP